MEEDHAVTCSRCRIRFEWPASSAAQGDTCPACEDAAPSANARGMEHDFPRIAVSAPSMVPSILDLATAAPSPVVSRAHAAAADSPRPAPRILAPVARPAPPRRPAWFGAAATLAASLGLTLAVMTGLSERERIARALPVLEPVARALDGPADRLASLPGIIATSPILTGSIGRPELAVRDVGSVRRLENGTERLVVRGRLVNEGGVHAEPSRLRVTIRGERGVALYSWTVAAGRELEAGGSRDFTAVSPYLPQGARDVVVRIDDR